MNYYITAHPIDRQLQEKLGIYDGYTPENGNCKSVSVGKVVSALVNAGHTTINSYVDHDRNMIVMHLSKK